MTPTPEPLAYNTRTAAELLGISYSGLRRLIADGTIRAARHGRLTMIPRAELERFLAEGMNRGA